MSRSEVGGGAEVWLKISHESMEFQGGSVVKTRAQPEYAVAMLAGLSLSLSFSLSLIRYMAMLAGTAFAADLLSLTHTLTHSL